MKFKSFIFSLLIFSNMVQASSSAPPDNFYAIRPADIDCVILAAKKQNIPANILLAISSMEMGRNGQFVSNSNGSIDLGHFQINTINWDRKNGLFAGVLDISPEDVAMRGCYNAELAAWLVNKRINENTGQDFWTRVANYHSKTEKFNKIYKNKLIPLVISWGQWLSRNNKDIAVSYK